MKNYNMELTTLDFMNEITADVYCGEEHCVVEGYYSRTGTKAYVVRWHGPKALEECEEFVAGRVLD